MKRATVYFEEDLHLALKMKAAETSVPVSELVNDAVRLSLLEDADDLEAFKERENEPVIDFESFVATLKKMVSPCMHACEPTTRSSSAHDHPLVPEPGTARRRDLHLCDLAAGICITPKDGFGRLRRSTCADRQTHT